MIHPFICRRTLRCQDKRRKKEGMGESSYSKPSVVQQNFPFIWMIVNIKKKVNWIYATATLLN